MAFVAAVCGRISGLAGLGVATGSVRMTVAAVPAVDNLAPLCW